MDRLRKCLIKKRIIIRNESGLTLLEVLSSMLIASLILVGVIEALIYLTAVGSLNKNRTLVFQDVQVTMERISGAPFGNLTTQFPDGQPLTSAFVTNVLGGYKLPSESITVSYPSGTASNPLEVLVSGQWNEQAAVRTVSLRTMRRG